MKTSVETVDPVTVKLTVEVEPVRVKASMDAAARDIGRNLSLPGFRPGKAPRRLIEQRVGAGAIAQQAMEASLSDYYAQALQEADVDPVAMPDIDLEAFDEQEGCRFVATVEVRPSFDPPDHTGIGVTFPEWDVSDDDVAAQLAAMRERFAEVDEVDRPAGTGDYVTLDLRVSVDGEELESAHVEDALYEIGSGGVTPKLDEELVGVTAGSDLTYTDTLPEAYPEHGGAEAEFTVTVKDVREKTLPELDDEFAMTASEFDTIDELRKEIRDGLLRRRIAEAQHELRGRILEAYLALVDIPLPPALIEQETDARVERLEQQAAQYGLEVDDLLAGQDLDLDTYRERAREQATAAVKAQMVLDQLAQTLELEVTPDDIDREVVRHAQEHNVSPQQIAEVIQQQGSVGAMVADIVRRKTIDAIVDAAEIDGGPSDEVLAELGLKPGPDDGDGDADGDEAAAADQLIVPGRDQGGEARTDSGLIVPGR